jgi:hypothetical protein
MAEAGPEGGSRGLSTPGALRAPETFAPDPSRDWFRMLGGLAFAVGALILFVRKAGGLGDGAEWAEFPLLLVVLVPCTLLYGLGVVGRTSGHPLQPWQSVLLVTGVLLVPLVLFQFLDTIGGNTGDSLNVAWIFAATAGLAAYASFNLGAAYQTFLGAVAAIVAWLAFWDKVLDDPSINTLRWLLIVIGVAYLAGALALRRREAPQAPELITGAGIAAVLVGILGAANVLAELAAGLFAPEFEGGGQSAFWDVFLLATSLALVAYGARVRARGPAYIGAIGLVVFILIIGVEVGAIADLEDPEGKLVGWPLILLLVGAAGLLAGLRPGRAGAPPPPGQPGEGPEATRGPEGPLAR